MLAGYVSVRRPRLRGLGPRRRARRAMKELTGSARAAVAASPEACLALLAAVDRYPTWYPEVVRAVDVVDREPSGQPTRAQTKLHLAQGPLTKDFDLLMAVAVQPPSTVSLTRVPHRPSDAER